ncbi:MAG: M24 family metallopeptidase [Candidatus Micrarchaeota archaeon]|nr:M24 family metallopeptidase [Candidatus Micrarchaeota archaeon]
MVSSSPLVNLTLVPVTKKQFASHLRAVRKLSAIANSAFSLISNSLRRGKPITEKQVQNHVVSLYSKYGFVSDRPPIVAFGKNAANIHHEAGASRLKRGELVLIDLWARETSFDSIYADMTLMAFAGKKNEIPQKFAKAFASLVRSRNSGLENMQKQFKKNGKIISHLADSAVRRALRGYPDYPHGTGHNILHDVHGPGPGILQKQKKAFELAPGGLYSLEPGIYVKNSFGMRSEIDFYFDSKKGVRTTTECQKELKPLL